MEMSAAAFRRVICEILEPRILYSADPIATPTGSDDGMIPVVADRLQTQDHQALSTPDVTAQAALDAAFSPARLVVVDQRAFNAQALLEGLSAEQDAGRPIVVLELGLEDDAIQRIAYAMSESGVRFGAVELHASAEGTSITLGSTSLDMATLRQRAFEFATWANSLESDAQIQVAQTSLAGAEITESLGVLGLLTGADVAVAPSERELVIIDSRVTDIDGLTRALLADQSESRRFELVVLGENENGIETIGRLLAGRQDLAAVHVLAHGASGVIELGASRIDLEALERYREAISGWSAALGENADLLLYGCDVGDGENGQAFARRLAELSGADVALSTDLTGSTALGGNWVLESHIGSIETRALFDRQEPMWLGTLAVVDNGSVATAQSTNTNSLSFFHTVNAGSDRMLIVTIAIDGLGANVTSVTYGGAALTQIGRGTGNHAVEIWGLVAPPVGTTDVVISLAGNSPIAAGATTFNGVDQASPTYGFASTSGLGTTASVTVASNTADRVVDVYYWDDNPAGNNVGAGQTLSWWASNAFLLAGSTTEPGAASVTMSTSVGSSVQWNAAAVSLRAGTTNQPPMINLPVAQVVNEDTSLVFSTGNGNAISISDPDAGASPMELTVGVTQGTLSLATTAGLTFLTGDGVADGIMSFRGTLASINAALDGLSYLAPTNYNGAATLSVSTRDGALVSLEIDANLQARYTFDGNPNDVAPGVAQHGTAMNGATYVADGTRGQVLSLDGVDDYVQIGSTFSNPTEITIGGWVNLLSAAGRSEFITLNDRFHIALDDGGAGVKGSVQTGAGSWQDLTSGTSIAGTGWHHVMYTYSDTADTHQLYIDGVLVASAAANLSPYWFGATETRIGAHPSNINFAHARVDDVRIYNRALTSAEVSALASDLTLRDSENLAITVNAVNDAPVVGTTGAPLSYTENALATAIDPNLTVTDVDSVNLTSASVSVSANYVNGQDLLGFTNQLGITGSWNTTTGVLTLSGSSSVANYQTALRSVTYRNLSDAPSTAARTVSFSASDGSLGSNVATRAINVQSINDPPVNAVPGAQATIEDTALVFSVGNGNAITISDLDVGANPSGITLSVSNGTLTLATVAGLTFTSGDGTADSTMNFSGTLASINAALNGLTYNPTSSYSGGAVLTVSTLDGLLFALDIDANLHAHYSFDGNANDVAPGASQNGVLTNGASIGSDGTRGQVLSLDGANDFVDLSGATASFAGFNQGTITGWIRATGAYSTIFSVSDTADSGSYASLFLGASGYLTFEVVENGVTQLAVYRSSAAINDGNWHHVAVAVGPGGNTLYVDGVQASAGQLTFDAGNASTQHFFSSVSGLDFAAVGRTQDSAGGKWHTLGSLDDVRVYSRALTAGEIQSLATDLVLRDADTVNITVAPINDSPVIAGLDGDLRSYTEGAAPVLLGSTSGITDPDSANFDTGTLTVSFTSGSDSAEDVLGIRNEGTGAGQIGVSVSNVTYGGVVIGTWSGGSGGTSLVVTLNSSANQTNVAALINNLTYFNTDDANPTTTTRNIRVVLTDGDGGTSANNDTSMTIAAANDAPIIASLPNAAASTTSSGGQGTAIATGDFDGDGDLDVIRGTLGGAILLHTNNGSGTLAAGVSLATLGGEVQEFEVADLDGDGDLDIASVTYTNLANPSVHILTNNGAGAFSVTSMETVSTGADSIAVGDIDGDGDLDLAVSFWFSDQVAWYEYVSPGNYVKHVIATPGGPISVNVADLDGDGDADITATSRNLNQVLWYENIAAGSSFTQHVALNIQDPFSSVTSDFDGDGDIDIAFSTLTLGVVGWLENSGGANPTFAEHRFEGTYGLVWQMSATDIDGDGDRDLLIADSNGDDLILFRNVGTDVFTRAIVDGSYSGARSAQAADLNSDGALEIVAAGDGSADINVYAGVGSAGFIRITTAEDTSAAVPGITISDVDAGSGQMQITLAAANGQLSLGTLAGLTFTTGDGTLDGTMVFTGTVANINAALATLTILPTANFNGDTWIDLTVNDQGNSGSGGALSAFERIGVRVTAVNDAPILNTTGSTLSYIENDPATTVDPGLSVSDIDSANLASATVSISANYVNGQDVLAFTNQLGITGSWNATTGVLTLSGASSVANYQTALRSVTYQNTSENPSTAIRTVAFVVNDGAANSNTGNRSISITPTADTPSVTGATTNEDIQSSAGLVISRNAGDGAEVTHFKITAISGGTLYQNDGVTPIADGSFITFAQGNAGLRFTPAPNSTASGSFVLQASTAGNDVGLGGGTTTATIAVNAVNDAPAFIGLDGAPTYVEGGAAVVLDGNVTVTDIELSAANNHDGATLLLQRNGGANADDQFSATGTLSPLTEGGALVVGGTTIGTVTTQSAGTLLLSFNASATSALVNSALQQIAYANASSTPPSSVQINWSFSDGNSGGQGTGGALSASGAITVSITTVDVAPTVTTTGSALVFPENDPATEIDPGLLATDSDSANLTGATVTISANYVSGEDVLGFTNQLGITGSWNAGTGVLTLSGVSSVANYQTALRSVTYLNGSENPSTATRTVSFVLDDGSSTSAAATRDITVVAVNDIPTLTVGGTTLGYTENDLATTIDPGLLVSDVDNANLAGATVSIVGNYVNGEDVLGFVNQLGITGSWNAASGVLTLSGVSSVANYQTALRSITYLNISENPSSATRTIAFVADDGLSSSNVGTRDISIAPVNDAPVVVTSGGSAAFVENGGPVVLDPALTVADADSTMLAGAVVRISANYMNGEDILAFTNQNGISGAWNATTGELTLSGVASLANYQAALRTISYANLAENPSAAARIVSIEVSDGTLGSIPANRTVTVTPVNDAPVLATSGAALAYGEADPPTAIDPGLTIADVDSGSLIAATVSISANYVNGEDLLAFTNQLGISGSWNAAAGVLTLSGNASIANYQTALRSVTYFNGSSNPSVAPRTISFEVDDGTDASLPATRGINLITLNDAPVVTTTGTSLSYTENDPATAIDPGLSVSDVDSPTLSGAIVTISANYANGQDVLAFTDQLGITGSWNAGTGTLTLSGVASVANYQTALRSVTYLNGSDNPNPLTRTVSFSVNDGATVSSASTRGVVLTAVNDPPSSPPVTLAGVAEDSGARLITQAELLANATDVDSAGLVATGLAITSGMGSLIDNGDGTWSYTPAANDDTAVTYSYSVSDGSLSVAASASLDLLPVNDPPQTSPVILASHPEDGGGRLITQAELLANASDTEGAALTAISLAISSGAGSLFNNGNGTWTYLPAADDSSAVSFSYLVSDAGLSATGSATLDLTPVNDAPLITTPTSLTLAEDSALAFGLAAGQVLQVFDVDAAGGTLRVSIGASNGLLTLGNRSGLSFIAGSGTGDRTMAFEGTMAAINLALDSLVYNPDANFNGNDSLSLQVDDLGNSGIGGPALATRTVQLVVAPANDPPAIVAPALVSGTEDTAVEFSAALGRAILLTDVDAGAQSIRLELATTGGTLRFANTAGLSVISGSTSAGNQVVVTGTLADLNAALAGLWFDPLGDYSGSATLSLRVDDQGATGAGAAFATNANIVIAIAAVNDAPTELARAPAIVVVESAAAGTSVGRIEVSDVDDTGGFSFSLLDDAGHFAIDPVTGEIMVASSQLPAYDLAPGYSIIVRAVDPSGAQIDRAFVIQAVRREVVPPPPQAREVGQTLKADRADSGKAERELVPVSDSENERERFVVAGDDADPRRRAAISQGGLTGMRRALDHSRASVTQDEAMRANDEAAARAAQSAADERLRRLSELRSNFRLLDFDRLKENDGGLGGNHESGMMARVPEQWLGRDSQDADARRYEAMIESVHVGGVALSIGLIMYAVRAGGLAAAMLTAIPAWQTMDPLAVLARDRNRDRAVAWQDDPDDEARMDDRAVGQVIDGGGQSEFTSTHYTTRGS